MRSGILGIKRSSDHQFSCPDIIGWSKIVLQSKISIVQIIIFFRSSDKTPYPLACLLIANSVRLEWLNTFLCKAIIPKLYPGWLCVLRVCISSTPMRQFWSSLPLSLRPASIWDVRPILREKRSQGRRTDIGKRSPFSKKNCRFQENNSKRSRLFCWSGLRPVKNQDWK